MLLQEHKGHDDLKNVERIANARLAAQIQRQEEAKRRAEQKAAAAAGAEHRRQEAERERRQKDEDALNEIMQKEEKLNQAREEREKDKEERLREKRERVRQRRDKRLDEIRQREEQWGAVIEEQGRAITPWKLQRPGGSNRFASVNSSCQQGGRGSLKSGRGRRRKWR
jgi:hypothetical protein